MRAVKNLHCRREEHDTVLVIIISAKVGAVGENASEGTW
jgi:hypothetical protein